MSYTVGRVSRLLGVSVRSLHHYDEIGLLIPSERSASGYRLYSQADIDRLYRIQTLRELGWSLAEVRGVIDGHDVQVLTRLDTQIRDLEQSIEEATELRLRLMQVRQHLPPVGSRASLGWLELFSLYNKHLSSDEIERLPLTLDAREKSEWQQLYADAAREVDAAAPCRSNAHVLAKRWLGFVARQLKSDLSLSHKLMRAYASDGAVRATLSSVAGIKPSVMRFIWTAVTHFHRVQLAKYLTTAERERVSFSDESIAERAHIVAKLWSALNIRDFDEAQVEATLRDWHRHVDSCTANDDALRRKVLSALGSDPWLRQLWMISDDLHERMIFARAYGDEELTE